MENTNASSATTTVTSDPTPPSTYKQRLRHHLPVIVRVLVILGLIATALLLFLYFRLHERLPQLLSQFEKRPWIAFTVYVALYMAISTLGVPVSVLTLCGGYLFRPIYVAVLVSLSCIWLCSTLQFFLARYLFQHRLITRSSSTSTSASSLTILKRAVQSEGWKISILVRLSLVVPFAVGNYVLALTELDYFTFAWTTVVATQPGLFVYTYIGSFMTNFADLSDIMDRNPKRSRIGMIVMGGCVVVAVTWITCISRRAWRRTVRRFGPNAETQGLHATPSSSSSLASSMEEERGLLQDSDSNTSHATLCSTADAVHRRCHDVEVVEDKVDEGKEPFFFTEKLAMASSVLAAVLVWSIGIPLVVFLS